MFIYTGYLFPGSKANKEAPPTVSRSGAGEKPDPLRSQAIYHSFTCLHLVKGVPPPPTREQVEEERFARRGGGSRESGSREGNAHCFLPQEDRCFF